MTDRYEKFPNLLKSGEQHLEDYKKIKEADWWKLCKFPLLICCIALTHMFSPSKSAAINVTAVFFVSAWLELSMQIYRVNKKLDIFYIIESNKSQKK